MAQIIIGFIVLYVLVEAVKAVIAWTAAHIGMILLGSSIIGMAIWLGKVSKNKPDGSNKQETLEVLYSRKPRYSSRNSQSPQNIGLPKSSPREAAVILRKPALPPPAGINVIFNASEPQVASSTERGLNKKDESLESLLRDAEQAIISVEEHRKKLCQKKDDA
jgi:hypothetical protein